MEQASITCSHTECFTFKQSKKKQNISVINRTNTNTENGKANGKGVCKQQKANAAGEVSRRKVLHGEMSRKGGEKGQHLECVTSVR